MQVRELHDTELNQITGGSITSSIINAVISAIETIYEFGKQFGSSIRRMNEGSYCPLK